MGFKAVRVGLALLITNKRQGCTMVTELDSMLAEAEPIIKYLALRAGRFHSLEYDDICQELRVAAVNLAERFDPSRGVPFKAYITNSLKFRLTDIRRRYGDTRRNGSRSRVHAFSLEQLREDTQDEYSIDPVDNGDTADSLIDWTDLVERCSSEHYLVQAIVMHAEGVTMASIGKRLGFSESRVSQMLSPAYTGYTRSLCRIRSLIEGNNHVERPIEMHHQAPVMNSRSTNVAMSTNDDSPIDQMLTVFENASDSTVRAIDQRIAELQSKLDRLSRMKRAIVEILGGAEPRRIATSMATKKPGGLAARIIEALPSGESVSVDSLASKLGVKPFGIRVSVAKTPQLTIVNDIVSNTSA